MALLTEPEAQPIGLILSGGGARAAYQIGVLRAIANILPKNAPNPFHVISGTSAGALNAASLATHAHRLRTGVRTLEHVWKNLSSTQIYALQSSSLLTGASGLLLSMLSGKRSDHAVALLNNAPLANLLSRAIKFNRIQRNIDLGLLNALSITASSYSTGESVSFYQAMHGIQDWRGPHRTGKRSVLNVQHLLASSAIPVIFPSVDIACQHFGDGSVRQLAPTSTAIHLGARRLLVIGVSGNRARSPHALDSTSSESEDMLLQPTVTQILGHIMNSAFVDTLENDLEFLRHMNDLVPLVPPGARKLHNIQVSEVELLEISPSKELNGIALQHYEELPKPLARYIKPTGSGALLSLILFEREFCTALWQLGFTDAMNKAEEIAAFFRLKA